MKCSNCGADAGEGNRFCPYCGNAMATEAAQNTVTPPPQAPGYIPPPPAMAGGKGGRKGLIIALVVIAIVVIGTVAGLLIWKFAGGDGLLAEITDIQLTLDDGSPVNLADVPIGEELSFSITVRAEYGEKGRGNLTYVLRDEAGEEQRKGDFKVKSSPDEQVFTDQFYFIWSEGETFTARVELVVEENDEEESITQSLEFFVAEGETVDEDLEAALERTEAKLDEATDVIVDLTINTDIGLDDLLQRLSEAYAALEDATTPEELEDIYSEGEAIIAECSSRKAAWDAEQAAQQQEENRRQQADRAAEIAACKQAMFDYAWGQMVTTPFYAEPVRIDGFWMNDSCTQAGGTMVGLKTVHTDPENAGSTVTVPISARKENGRWVAVFEAI